MERVINMVIRQVVRQVVNRGMNAGIDKLTQGRADATPSNKPKPNKTATAPRRRCN